MVFHTAYDALRASAMRAPDKTAIKFADRTISYSAFIELIGSAAFRLQRLGVRKGSAFSVYSQNQPELLVYYYAASKLGAVFVPLNPNLTASEVEYAFRHSGALFLLFDLGVAETAEKAVPPEQLHPLLTLTEPVQQKTSDDTSLIDPDDDFLVIYTSGSTGTPKAIVLSHRSQVAAANALSQMWGIGPRDVTVVGLPLGYLYGLSTAAAVGLQAGGTVVVLQRFRPGDALEALVAHKATVYHGVPTMYSMMLEYCEQRDLKYDLSDVRALICAGAPLPSEMRVRFAARFGRGLQDYYAMTECTPVFGVYADDPRPVPDQAIGRLAPQATVRILRANGSDCVEGEEGEILVRGAATMKRYLNSPELTSAAMTNGFLRSGDIGRVDKNGFYYITGRSKDVIIRGGANISPSEVEGVLGSHPCVQDVAVVGAPDHIFGEVPIAFVVQRAGTTVSEEDLVKHAEALLSDFKVPRQYLFTSDLPLGKTGKVDKTELKRRILEAPRS